MGEDDHPDGWSLLSLYNKTKEEQKMDKILLIDGHSILNRAFFGLPDLTNSDGLHTNAIYGFLTILFKVLEEESPQYLAVAFDRSEPTFRHELYEDYKGNRGKMADELRQQVPVMKKVLRAMEIPVLELPGYEADDILGTIGRHSEENGLEVRILSGDRDLLQLATEHTMIRIPKTKKSGTEVEDYFPEDVKEKYRVSPTEFIDVKALMGDSSDNISGVPGIGEKTATNLIEQYGSIENVWKHIDEIKPPRAKNALLEHYQLAVDSKKLVTILTDAPVSFSIEDAKIGKLYTEEAYQYFKELEFKNLLSRFDGENSNEELERGFEVLHTKKEIDQYFVECQKDTVAVILSPDEYSDLTVSDGKRSVYITTEEYSIKELFDKVSNLLKETSCIVTSDLKRLQKKVGNIPQDKAVDITILAYLLNPLKNEYTYDDLAKDYLGWMVPSAEDLFGKMKRSRARKEKETEYRRLCTYEAFVAYKVKDILLESVTEQGMLHLYQDIELPLVYTLADMELEGIKTDASALKTYGESLSSGISDLESSIYELAGETFNINSPKQLGVILFEKLKMPNGKKDEDRIFYGC